DLVASKDHETIAIEIETGKSDIKRNISKALKIFQRLFIITTNPTAEVLAREIADKIAGQRRKGVEIIPAKDLD
ncbi:MAG: hypothetical protein JRG73_21170, partial [Deltaproteobacteria bacterium]|nr:hypothetical protein [Deltaproteobacteria bacterium]